MEAIPDALNRANLSMEDVRKALASANAFLPKGMLENENSFWLVGASDQLRKAEDYKPLIVARTRAELSGSRMWPGWRIPRRTCATWP